MEFGKFNLDNLNIIPPKIPVVARALKDVIHNRVVISAAIFNFEAGFDLDPEQLEVWNADPITFDDAMGRRQSSDQTS